MLMSNKFFLGGHDIKMIELVNGRRLLMVNGYSFHRHKRSSSQAFRWCCSSYKKKCPAYVIMTNDNTCITRSLLDHTNHEVPMYNDLPNGKWIRL